MNEWILPYGGKEWCALAYVRGIRLVLHKFPDPYNINIRFLETNKAAQSILAALF